MCAALFSFLRNEFHLSLRAVIDTGGKSLHGWFDHPTPRATAGLTRLAEGLAIDTNVLANAAAFPLRLPGCLHTTTGQRARLLYLKPISMR